jgi:hypothetical protein
MVARMALRGLVAALISLAIVAHSAGARAADGAEIEALIAKGNDLRRAGTPGPALPYFRRAYELARTPRTTGQLGLAELAAGYPVEAAEHLTAALQSPDDPSIVKYREILEDSLQKARAQIGELTVQGGPAGAEVMVDGRAVGVLPLPAPVKLPARAAEVVVRAPGFAPHRELVPIAGGQHHELIVNLVKTDRPVGPAASTPTSGGPPSAGGGATTPSPLTPDLPPARDDSAATLRTSAWIAGGAAVAVAGTGLVLNLVSNSKSDDFNHDCSNPPGGIKHLQNSTVTDAECRNRYDSWQSYLRWSLVSYVGGAALAVTSGVLFWISRPTPAAGDTHAHVTCAPTPAGLSCQGVF